MILQLGLQVASIIGHLIVFSVLAVMLVDSLLRLFFMVTFSRNSFQHRPAAINPPLRMVLVIPAHDETPVISSTLDHLAAQTLPADVWVIADNCTDDTAAIARRAGAEVWERHDTSDVGKGAAIRWLFDVAADRLQAYDAVAILDADACPDPEFISRAGAVLSGGVDVVQGLVYPLSKGTPAADLAAYSELISQRIDDTARSALGWPIPLRGTGMVFRRQVLVALIPQLQTRVEDIEMSLLLAAWNKRVQFVSNAIVGDPKPGSTRDVARQRARWLQGQRQVLSCHRTLIWSFLRGARLGSFSLLLALLLKPKTLVFMLKILLLALSPLAHLVSPSMAWILITLSGLALSIDLVYYMVGLGLVETPGRYARALALAPLYLVTWLWSLAWSFVSSSPWLRVSRE